MMQKELKIIILATSIIDKCEQLYNIPLIYIQNGFDPVHLIRVLLTLIVNALNTREDINALADAIRLYAHTGKIPEYFLRDLAKKRRKKINFIDDYAEKHEMEPDEAVDYFLNAIYNDDFDPFEDEDDDADAEDKT